MHSRDPFSPPSRFHSTDSPTMRWGSKRFDQDVDVDVVSVDPQAQLRAQLDPQGKGLEVRKSAAERKFLLKLDIFLLTYGCLSQVIKYLDQTNINTAYVSGMSEALNFEGNELNYFATWFNVGCKPARNSLTDGRLYLPDPLADLHHVLPTVALAPGTRAAVGHFHRLHCRVQDRVPHLRPACAHRCCRVVVVPRNGHSAE